MNQAAAWPF